MNINDEASVNHSTNNELSDVPAVPVANAQEFNEMYGNEPEDTSVPPVPPVPPVPSENGFYVDEKGFYGSPGVYFLGDRNPVRICSLLYVTAITHADGDSNFGRNLKFTNSLGRWCNCTIPMRILKGRGDELRGILLDHGAELGTSHRARDLLLQYLQTEKPEKVFACTSQTGWYKGSFLTGSRVIGDDSVVLQTDTISVQAQGERGSLGEWRESVAALAVGNPLLTLAIGLGFTGPLLKLANGESGGLHFVGKSSCGKSTMLNAACSVWGGPDYKKTWCATANGMEGVAAAHNDCLLALDELSECSPLDADKIVYAIGNGVGKSRANRHGGARISAKWRCAVLSTGERNLETTLSQANRTPQAGQSVRLLEIPVERRYGAWDDLHHCWDGGEMSDEIKRATNSNFGVAGPMFVEYLVSPEYRKEVEDVLRIAREQLTENAKSGQESRGASRLAIIGAAGELATRFGLTGWPTGAALDAAHVAFNLWRSARGTSGDSESKAVLQKLQSYLEKYEESRFSRRNDSSAFPIKERASWWDRPHPSQPKTFYLTTDGIKEATKGTDLRQAKKILTGEGVLLCEKSKPLNFDGYKHRVYAVDSAVLADRLEQLEQGGE